MRMPSIRSLRPHVAKTVCERIESGGDRPWRLQDFAGLSMQAVAQALSRLARRGEITRLGKGLYYRARPTSFGPSLPSPTQLRNLPIRGKRLFPVGVAAAGVLGLTTQSPARIELATDGPSFPRLIVGKEALIHTRRPVAWRSLSEVDAALLDFLRNRGMAGEFEEEETVRKLLVLFDQPKRYESVLRVAPSEPPRVRAMLGAIGQKLGKPERLLARLREGLNSISKFNFGRLRALPHAAEWQAK
jgi:hypothetical protein